MLVLNNLFCEVLKNENENELRNEWKLNWELKTKNKKNKKKIKIIIKKKTRILGSWAADHFK